MRIASCDKTQSFLFPHHPWGHESNVHFQYPWIKWRLSFQKQKHHPDSWVLSLILKMSTQSKGKKISFLKARRMKCCVVFFCAFPYIQQVTQPLAMLPERITGLCSALEQPLPKWMPGIRPTIVSFTFSTTAEAWRKLPPSSSPPHPPSPPPRPTHGDVRKEADQMQAVRNYVS